MKLVSLETSALTSKLPQWWKDMTLAEKKKYIKEHPNSKYKGALQTAIKRDKTLKAKKAASGTTKSSKKTGVDKIKEASDEIKKLASKKSVVAFDQPVSGGVTKILSNETYTKARKSTQAQFDKLLDKYRVTDHTEYEEDAIKSYLADDYIFINRYLRDTDTSKSRIRASTSRSKAEITDMANTLTGLLKRAPVLKEPVKVFRGMPANDEYIEKLKRNVGKPMNYRGIISTTMSPAVAGNFANPAYQALDKNADKSVIFNITVPKGKRAYFVPANNLMLNGGEQEVLLNHHTKFGVKKVYVKDGVTQVDLEVQ